MKKIAKDVRKFGGFTLVELIVVITILAVLATIGFLALSGFSQDAKDSATKANVRSIQTAIASESALTNNSPRYYVVHDPDYALSGAMVYFDGTGLVLTGGNVGQAPLDSNYTAGKPDYAKLKLNPEKFRISDAFGFSESESVFAAYDPQSAFVGAVDVSRMGENGKKRNTSYFQVGAVSPSTKVASVNGNFPVS
ncbi:MAG: type II secretion system protein [Patescibacteria group bacterium]